MCRVFNTLSTNPTKWSNTDVLFSYFFIYFCLYLSLLFPAFLKYELTWTNKKNNKKNPSNKAKEITERVDGKKKPFLTAE